jgi:hypothetical protein
MSSHRTAPSDSVAFGLAAFLLFFGAFFRIVRLEWMPGLPNFAPLMAIAFCGALVLPPRLAVFAPLGALLFSDILLNLHYGAAPLGWGELVRCACYLIAVGSGILLSRHPVGWTEKLSAVAANSLVFYLVTNSASWLASSDYGKSLAGWIQALTVGTPGFPPSYLFFRNSLVSDLLFTLVFLAALRLAENATEGMPAPAATGDATEGR